jgi:hypothetical protein
VCGVYATTSPPISGDRQQSPIAGPDRVVYIAGTAPLIDNVFPFHKLYWIADRDMPAQATYIALRPHGAKTQEAWRRNDAGRFLRNGCEPRDRRRCLSFLHVSAVRQATALLYNTDTYVATNYLLFVRIVSGTLTNEHGFLPASFTAKQDKQCNGRRQP